MARFHDLTVTRIDPTTRDAVVVTLRPESGDFAFTQGQYLTFRRTFDGQEVRRSYSICSGVQEGVLQVGIKRVDGGAFSTWANTELRVGDTLQAMEPAGRFHTPLDAGAARHYLGLAAGSGITPILSILKTTLAAEPQSRFTLVYANRALHSVMFRDTLEDLKNRHMDRLTLVHILKSDAQDIELFHGRLDADKCAALFAGWIDVGTVDTAFICGPEAMMHVISASLRDHGMTEDRIKYELFATAQPGRLPRSAATATAATSLFDLAVTMDGATRALRADPDQTLLEAALAGGIDVPFACRAGICSTCRCRVTEGTVEMDANHALEDDEVARGFVLSCQARPLTDSVAVDYDVQH